MDAGVDGDSGRTSPWQDLNSRPLDYPEKLNWNT